IDSRVVKFVDVFVHGFDQRGPVEGLATLAQQASQNALFRSRQMKAVIHAVRENPATFYQRPARSTRWRGRTMRREPLVESEHRRGKLSHIDRFDEIRIGTVLKPIDTFG